jgi:hypothetical protein
VKTESTFTPARAFFMNMLIPAFLMGLLFVMARQASGQCMTSPGTPNITGNVPFGPPINWANPNRVEISDDLYAHVKMDAGETSKYLEVKDFGFVIPAGSAILGISAVVECQQEVGAFYKAASVRLMKGGVITGNDKAGSMIIPEGIDQSNILGGPVDLWGDTWTDTDIMDPDFGMVVSVTRTAGPPNLDAYIDYIQIVIYYDDGSGCILPVTFSSLDARSVSSSSVQIAWTTASEVNNDFFSVQRSSDGQNFETIGTVAASGTSTTPVHYSFTDNNASGGGLYYRISETDLSGNRAYSQVIAVAPDQGAGTFTSGPNPASESLNVYFSQAAESITVELFSMDGRQVQVTHPADGSSTLSLDVSALPEGMYILRVTDKLGNITTSRNIVN